MTKSKLKLEMEYDDGLTTYNLVDTTILKKDDVSSLFATLLTIEVHDGNFKIGSENKYHTKVKRFLEELIEEGDGWE